MVGRDYIELRTLTLEELTGVVNLYPWYGAAHKELCRRMAEAGGEDWGERQYAREALYVADRGKLAPFLRQGRRADCSDKDVQEILRSFIATEAPENEETADNSHGVHVEVIIGAKTKDLMIYEQEMSQVCDKLHVCTDDGSYGFHGLVTAMLEKLVADGARYDQAVAIGPMIMMKFATLTCRKLGIPVIVSLNTLMVDGTGMCGACRVTVGGKTRFACVDGPEFDGYEVDFDEAMRRQGQYKTEEAATNEHHICRIGRGK